MISTSIIGIVAGGTFAPAVVTDSVADIRCCPENKTPP